MNTRTSPTHRLVLASSSPYRKQLLTKLGLPFEAASPSIAETPKPDETPTQLSLRLAAEKAQALTGRFPQHLIIGSDQVAMLEGKQLGKPENAERAMSQLRAASGRVMEFFTSVCVLNSASGEILADTDLTRVHFRPLTERQIARYLLKDEPFDCAGSFKSESLGIALFEKLETEDPNALIGLPLIRLIGLLERFGLEIP
ncbi:MAG: Maf family protein [Methylococcaceae bacterium]|nr:Maf family protein [Methylococcaceae bacterium]